jgi:hypothetical protein
LAATQATKHGFRLNTPKQRARRLDVSAKGVDPRVKQYLGQYEAVFQKDVLKTSSGKGWHTDAGPWPVGQSEIKQIVHDFNRYIEAGNSPPALCWDHSDSSRDVCGEVVGLAVTKDGELDALLASNDSKAIKALEVNRVPVSIQVQPDATDGMGNHYPLLLEHVALCQRPVIPGQQPAKRLLSQRRNSSMFRFNLPGMGLGKGKGKSTKRLAQDDDSTDTGSDEGGEGGGDDSDAGPADEATEISVVEVVSLIEEHFGIEAPSVEVSTVKELKIWLESKTSGMDDAPADDDAADDTMPAAPLADTTAAQFSRAGGKGKQAKSDREIELEKRLSQFEKRDADARKASRAKARENFKAKLNKLCHEKKIKAAHRGELLTVGKRTGWSLSILKPYEDREPFAKSGSARTTTGSVSDESEFTEERRKELLKLARSGNFSNGEQTSNAKRT